MRHLLSPLIKVVLRKHYADLARMEDVLRDSGLDWTVIRPPRLTDDALTSTSNLFPVSVKFNGWRIIILNVSFGK